MRPFDLFGGPLVKHVVSPGPCLLRIPYDQILLKRHFTFSERRVLPQKEEVRRVHESNGRGGLQGFKDLVHWFHKIMVGVDKICST